MIQIRNALRIHRETGFLFIEQPIIIFMLIASITYIFHGIIHKIVVYFFFIRFKDK